MVNARRTVFGGVRRRRTAGGATPRAFTLLELLVAMVLASMVMLLTAGAVRATVRAVGETTVDRQQGERDERIRALLSAQMAWLQVDEARAPVRFVGRNLSLDVQTMCALAAPHRRDQATARWRIVPSEDGEGVDLIYGEASVRRGADRPADQDPVEASRADAETLEQDLDPERGRSLLGNLSAASFQYLASTAGPEPTWVDDWRDPGLPRALRLAVTTKEGERKTWLIPVAVTF